MSAMERARKIVEWLIDNRARQVPTSRAEKLIAAEIEAAERDAFNKGLRSLADKRAELYKEGYERARIDLNALHSAKWKKEDYAEGFRAAQERAVEIVDDYFSSGIKIDNRSLAERIKGMKI